MSKSNKELAVELTISFIQSWNAKTTTKALRSNEANEILTQFYLALSNIDTKEN